MNTIEKNINVIEISDISAPELDVFARMTETQLRSKLEPEKGIFIAESPTVIRIALDAGYEPLSLLVEKKHFFLLLRFDRHKQPYHSNPVYPLLLKTVQH